MSGEVTFGEWRRLLERRDQLEARLCNNRFEETDEEVCVAEVEVRPVALHVLEREAPPRICGQKVWATGSQRLRTKPSAKRAPRTPGRPALHAPRCPCATPFPYLKRLRSRVVQPSLRAGCKLRAHCEQNEVNVESLRPSVQSVNDPFHRTWYREPVSPRKLSARMSLSVCSNTLKKNALTVGEFLERKPTDMTKQMLCMAHATNNFEHFKAKLTLSSVVARKRHQKQARRSTITALISAALIVLAVPLVKKGINYRFAFKLAIYLAGSQIKLHTVEANTACNLLDLRKLMEFAYLKRGLLHRKSWHFKGVKPSVAVVKTEEEYITYSEVVDREAAFIDTAKERLRVYGDTSLRTGLQHIMLREKQQQQRLVKLERLYDALLDLRMSGESWRLAINEYPSVSQTHFPLAQYIRPLTPVSLTPKEDKRMFNLLSVAKVLAPVASHLKNQKLVTTVANVKKKSVMDKLKPSKAAPSPSPSPVVKWVLPILYVVLSNRDSFDMDKHEMNLIRKYLNHGCCALEVSGVILTFGEWLALNDDPSLSYKLSFPDSYLHRTPAHEAIVLRNQEGLKLIAQYGGNLLGKDCRGQTPLHIAVEKGDMELVELLFALRKVQIDTAEKEAAYEDSKEGEAGKVLTADTAVEAPNGNKDAPPPPPERVRKQSVKERAEQIIEAGLRAKVRPTSAKRTKRRTVIRDKIMNRRSNEKTRKSFMAKRSYKSACSEGIAGYHSFRKQRLQEAATAQAKEEEDRKEQAFAETSFVETPAATPAAPALPAAADPTPPVKEPQAAPPQKEEEEGLSLIKRILCRPATAKQKKTAREKLMEEEAAEARDKSSVTNTVVRSSAKRNMLNSVLGRIVTREDEKRPPVRLIKDNELSGNVEDNQGRTPISLALGKGHKELTLYLLKQGASLANEDEYGVPLIQRAQQMFSPLEYVKSGNIEMLCTCYEVNLWKAHRRDVFSGRTLLHWAALYALPEVCQKLMDLGEDPATYSHGNGLTPVHEAIWRGDLPTLTCLIRGRENELLSQPTLLFLDDGEDHETAFPIHLSLTTRFPSTAVTQKIVSCTHVQIYGKDDTERNIFHCASSTGRPAELQDILYRMRYMKNDRQLIEMVNARDIEGDTPISVAVKGNHPACVDALLKSGAIDTSVLNSRERHILLVAADVRSAFLCGTLYPPNCPARQSIPALILLDYCTEECVRTLSGCAGKRTTALHVAVASDDFLLSTELLTKGASIAQQDDAGETPMGIACRRGNTKLLVLLIANSRHELGSSDLLGEVLASKGWGDRVMESVLETSCPDLSTHGQQIFHRSCVSLMIRSVQLLLEKGCGFDPRDSPFALLQAAAQKRQVAGIEGVLQMCYMRGTHLVSDVPIPALCCKLQLWDICERAVADPACAWDWSLRWEVDSNRTPLHYICLNGPASLLKSVLERQHGMTNICDTEGMNALSYSLQRQSVQHAAELLVRCDAGCLTEQILIRRGLRPEAEPFVYDHRLPEDRQITDEALNSVCAGYAGHAPEVAIHARLAFHVQASESAADASFASPKLPTEAPRTAVHGGKFALFSVSEVATNKSMSHLLRKGVKRGVFGDNLVHWAVMHNDSVLTKLLITVGEDYDVVNSRARKNSALGIPVGASPLWVAAAMVCRSCAIELLDNPNCDVNQECDTGETPLGAALRLGCTSMAHLLIQRGAFVNSPACVSVVHFNHLETLPSAATRRLTSHTACDYMARCQKTRLVEVSNMLPFVAGLRCVRTLNMAQRLAGISGDNMMTELPGLPVTMRVDEMSCAVSPLCVMLGGMRILPSEHTLREILTTLITPDKGGKASLGLHRLDPWGRSLVEYTLRAGRPLFATLLLTTGAPGWVQNSCKTGGHAIHLFALEGSASGVSKCLSAVDVPEKNVAVNARDSLGRTPLICAVRAPVIKNAALVASLLLGEGARVIERDSVGRTVLSHACSHPASSESLVELVLRSVTDHFDVDTKRNKAEDVANMFGAFLSVTSDTTATGAPEPEESQGDKQQDFADHVNSIDTHNNSALHYLCKSRHIKALKLLLQIEGLDIEPGLPRMKEWELGESLPRQPDTIATVGGYGTVAVKQKLTPFLEAVLAGRESVAQAIVTHSFQRNVALRTQYMNSKGETTHHFIAKNNMLYTLKGLLQLEKMMEDMKNSDGTLDALSAEKLQNAGKNYPQHFAFERSATFGDPNADDASFGGINPLGYSLLFNGMNVMNGSCVGSVLWKREHSRQHSCIKVVLDKLLPHNNWHRMGNSPLSVFAYGQDGVKILSRAIPQHEPTVDDEMWIAALSGDDDALAKTLDKGTDDMRRIKICNLPPLTDVAMCVIREEDARTRGSMQTSIHENNSSRCGSSVNVALMRGGSTRSRQGKGREVSHADCSQKLKQALMKALRCVRIMNIEVPENDAEWDHTCTTTLKYVAEASSLLRQKTVTILRGNKVRLERAPLEGPDYRSDLQRGRTSMLHIAARRNLYKSLVVMLDSHRDEEDRELSSDFVQRLNFRDAHGYTPLHYSISQSLHEITSLLLRNGASLEVRDVTGGLTPTQVIPSVKSFHGLSQLFGKKRVPFQFIGSFKAAAKRKSEKPLRPAFVLPGDCWDANVSTIELNETERLSEEDVMNMLVNEEVNKGFSSSVLQISEAALNDRLNSQVEALRAQIVKIAKDSLNFHLENRSHVLPITESQGTKRFLASMNGFNDNYDPIDTARQLIAHLSTLPITILISTAEELSRLERTRSLTVALHGIVGGLVGRELHGALSSFTRARGVYGQKCLLVIKQINMSFVGGKKHVGTTIQRGQSYTDVIVNICIFCGPESVVVEPVEDVFVKYFGMREAAAAARVTNTISAAQASKELGNLSYIPPMTVYVNTEIWRRYFSLHCAGIGLQINAHETQELVRGETKEEKDAAMAALDAISACLTPPLLFREEDSIQKDLAGEWVSEPYVAPIEGVGEWLDAEEEDCETSSSSSSSSSGKRAVSVNVDHGDLASNMKKKSLAAPEDAAGHGKKVSLTLPSGELHVSEKRLTLSPSDCIIESCDADDSGPCGFSGIYQSPNFVVTTPAPDTAKKNILSTPALADHTNSLFPSILSDLLVRRAGFFSERKHLHLVFFEEGENLEQGEHAAFRCAPATTASMGSFVRSEAQRRKSASVNDLKDEEEVVIICGIAGSAIVSVSCLPVSRIIWDEMRHRVVRGSLRYNRIQKGRTKQHRTSKSASINSFAQSARPSKFGLSIIDPALPAFSPKNKEDDLVRIFEQNLQKMLYLQAEVNKMTCPVAECEGEEAVAERARSTAVLRVVFEFGADLSSLRSLSGACRSWYHCIAEIVRDTSYIRGVLDMNLQQLRSASDAARTKLCTKVPRLAEANLEAFCIKLLQNPHKRFPRHMPLLIEYCCALTRQRCSQNIVWSCIDRLQTMQHRLTHILKEAAE